MKAPTLVIRADADAAMGIGHIMRCLGIAQAWQEAGGECLLAAFGLNASIEARIRSEGIRTRSLRCGRGEPQDVEELLQLAKQEDAGWIIVDGYHFTADYQCAVKAAGFKLLFADDYGHGKKYVADIVLNQNIEATETLYREREPYTQLLLGIEFFALRREFVQWGSCDRKVPAVARRILVSMGGGDPDNISLQVVKALQSAGIENLEVIVVVGASNPHEKSLEKACSQGGFLCRLEKNTTRMPELMAWAEFAVSAGGGTCYELAFLQVPTLLITMAENHQQTCETLAAHGAAIHAGWFHTLTAEVLIQILQDALNNRELRHSLIKNAQELIDGNGSRRVVKAMLSESD